MGNNEETDAMEVRVYTANTASYSAMNGEIGDDNTSAKSCISQCSGCMCNCRCSCSGGYVSDVEWEVI